jgi:hypothetical protein
MAKEITRELRNRLMPKKGGLSKKSSDQIVLFRAILSSFTDFLFKRVGDVYIKEGDEERQLDKHSILFTTKPEMVIGIPFDLIITRENPRTGVSEKLHLPLITFATEVSLKILDQLNPFSYRREKTVIIDDGHLKIHHVVHFGGKIISSYFASPNWPDQQEREEVIRKAYRWAKEHQAQFNFDQKREDIYHHFQKSKRVLGKELKPFQFYWKKFLENEIRENLKNEHLDYFIKFHPGFKRITLNQLLPPHLIQRLKKNCWPGSHTIGGNNFTVSYFKSRPFITPSLDLFATMLKEDLILASGERAGVILKNRRINDWDHAVYIFNHWKKKQLFTNKWKNLKKKVRIEDVEKIPFPQPFEGGRGMEGIKFEFYAVPHISPKGIFLIHFMDRDKAEKYFTSIQPQWQDAVRQSKKKKIETIFKEKGWKVKS